MFKKKAKKKSKAKPKTDPSSIPDEAARIRTTNLPEPPAAPRASAEVGVLGVEGDPYSPKHGAATVSVSSAATLYGAFKDTSSPATK